MGKRKKIALLVGQPDEYYQSEIIMGFEQRAFESDYDVCVFASYIKYQNTPEREIGEVSIFSMIPYSEFDGIIIMSDTLQTPGLEDSLEKLVKDNAQCPVICVDKKSDNFFSVLPNHYDGMKKIVNHMIDEHGYTDIAFLTGKAWHPFSKERLKAFTDAMSEHDLDVDDNRIFYGDFWYTSGENVAERLLRTEDKLPQAIICANDCMAIGVAKGLSERGVRIPEDVAVAGYDSTDEARTAPVPITSIKLPTYTYGNYLADTIDRMINGLEPERFEDSGEMFLGNSCGCKGDDSFIRETRRSRWETDISSNSVYSTFNHMDEDLLIPNSFNSLANIMYLYLYQIREFESFSICLNDDWQERSQKPVAREGDEAITPGLLAGPDRFFSDKFIHVLDCRKEELKCDKISTDTIITNKSLIPRLDENRDLPEVFFFTPLHFENMVFGYSVISYTKPASYGDSYRIWLHSAMRGLEYYRREEQLRRANAELEASLVRDPLTGLYNYKGFALMIDNILMQYRGSGQKHIGVLAVDIKNLSDINDKDGRAAGDKAIVHVSRFMSESFPEGTVFSFGNGEVVAVDSVSDDDAEFDNELSEINAKLKKFNQKHKYIVPVEIYEGFADGEPQDKNELDRIAGLAMLRKNNRKNTLRRMGDGADNEDDRHAAEVVSDILDNNKINYHFQPIVSAKTGDIFAYEALMRPDSNPYIQPLSVIKYAKAMGRLYDVESATINNVLDIVNEKSDDFCQGSKVFINSIPGQHLQQKDITHIKETTDKYSGRIVIEFTEQDELSDEELADIKDTYRSLGVATAVDDYGTGYSNVGNLLRYMPNYVKIDRSLLSEIQNSTQKQHLVKDIVSFCHDNGITVLAEGVETSAELAAVIYLGVDLIQGYYTAKPSGDIAKEIDPEKKNEILRFNAAEEERLNRSIYVAGREERVHTQKLSSGGFNTIRVTNGKVTYRDITVTGIPGENADIDMVIDDGYNGCIMLENASFSGKRKHASIVIGENCDVMLRLNGENCLHYGGIRVPESSKLILEGDGNLCIDMTDADAFGIGGCSQDRAGSITFEQNGIVEINVSGEKALCIGAGKGADIAIRRGRYRLSVTGQDGVAIGSLDEDIEPIVNNCAMSINNGAINAVGIGSIRGKTNVYMEHTSTECAFDSNHVTVMGSLYSKETKVKVYSAIFTTSMNASEGVLYGTLEDDPESVSVEIDSLSLRMNCEGKMVSFFRGVDKKTRIRITNSKVDGKILSGMDAPFSPDDTDIVIKNSSVSISKNGRIAHQKDY